MINISFERFQIPSLIRNMGKEHIKKARFIFHMSSGEFYIRNTRNLITHVGDTDINHKHKKD